MDRPGVCFHQIEFHLREPLKAQTYLARICGLVEKRVGSSQ